MNLSNIATGMFIEKLCGGVVGLHEGDVTKALGGLLGDNNGNIDLASIIMKLDVSGLASLAESWLAEARKIAGWDSGPEYAPHPINSAPADEDEQ